MRVLKVKKPDVFPAFVLGTLILQSLVLVILFGELYLMARLSRKPAPSLVQLVDGRAIQTAPQGHLERTPETIRRFLNETMTLMFSWSGTLPPETVEEAKSPKPDSGVLVQNKQMRGNRVTTATWEASFALAEDFRKPFVEKLATLTPDSVFDKKGTKGLLVIRRIGEPQAIAPGKWKVAVIANLILFSSQDRVGSAIPFNKEVFVAATTPPTQPLAEKADGLEQIVYRTRQAGLEIYAMRDLPKEDL